MNRVKALITFGETAQRFTAFAEDCGVAHIVQAGKMDDAVEKAINHSASGDTILLSPACASWDQYDSFEIRGDAFITAVQQMTEANE